MPRQEHNSSVSVSVNANAVSQNTRFKTLTVSTTPVVEAKADAVRLEGRTSVLVSAHPDNTGLVYVGLGDVDTLTTANASDCLGAGSARVYETKGGGVFLLGSASDQKVMITEVV